jgi:predicted metal-dependent HD superfamily phosphohydrolase
MLLAMGYSVPLDLLRQWNALAARVGLDDPGDGDGRELLLRWQEPHRRYHDERHLAAMLVDVDLLADEADDPDLVRLAAWFHDAVYAPAASDNETASAALAAAVLREGGLPAPRIAEVARLVRLTTTHDADAQDRNGCVLCDADLAVLGGTATEYASYASDVREEFAHVDDDAFRTGRVAVLTRLLDKQPLYRTQRYRNDREHVARHNMQTELTLLTAGAADSVDAAATPPP